MKRNNPPPTTLWLRRSWIAAALLIASLVCFWFYWTSIPKLNASEGAMKTVDALFTAINAQDVKRVALCRTRLQQFEKNGELGHRAMLEIANCCEQAEAGSWEQAARRLYHVIERQ